MKAILTRYLSATEKRNARIVATAEGGHRVVIPYDDGTSATNEDRHREAARLLCWKAGFVDKESAHTVDLVSGGLPNGDVCHVFVKTLNGIHRQWWVGPSPALP